MRHGFVYFLLLLLAPAAALALSGIGVSDWGISGYGNKSQIRSYVIENNELVRTDTLYTGGVHCPAINTYGTHVAFFRVVGDQAALSVMRIDGDRTKIKDLVLLDGGNIRRYLDWPRGDWIYYNPTNGRDVFRRVNVQTGADEHVLSVSGWDDQNHICEWRMSSDARLIHANVKSRHVLELDGDGVLNTAKWEDGGNAVGQGCTPTISPSGRYITATTDAGHNVHAVMEVMFSPRQLVWAGRSTSADWAAWQQGEWPTVQGGVFGGNCGLAGNSFSRNSDKWVCYASGMDDKARFGTNGLNLLAVNWQDSIAVNVSRYPSTKDGTHYRSQVFNLDFWVKAPLADVLPSMQADVTANGAYFIADLDEESVIREPLAAAAHRSATAWRVHLQRDGSIAIDAPAAAIGAQMHFFALNGSLVYHHHIGTTRQTLARPAGMYVVRFSDRFTKLSQSMILVW